MALAFLLRCTLDTETMPYYHAPLFATLRAWDVTRGERLPVRALAAAAVGYVLFDRLAVYLVSPDTAAWLYGAVTLAGASLLLGRLRPVRGGVAAGAAGVAGAPARP